MKNDPSGTSALAPQPEPLPSDLTNQVGPVARRIRARLGLGLPGELPSTGFLPLTLALTLFVMGLFAVGIIPTARCQSVDLTSAAP